MKQERKQKKVAKRQTKNQTLGHKGSENENQE